MGDISINRLFKWFKFRFRKLKLKISGIIFTNFIKVFKKNGVKIHVPFELTDTEFRGRFLLNSYEKEEAKYLSKFLPSSAQILELGSCLGFISCLSNKIIDNGFNHVVLEANPNLIPWIKKNKEVNNCKFSIENSIISKNKLNTFYIHDLIVGGSTKRKTGKEVIIDGVNFDFLEHKYSISFDTLIMDIEGGELEVLRNFQKDIAKLKRVFLELHPFSGILTKEEASECEEILMSLGFTVKLNENHFQIWEK